MEGGPIERSKPESVTFVSEVCRDLAVDSLVLEYIRNPSQWTEIELLGHFTAPCSIVSVEFC